MITRRVWFGTILAAISTKLGSAFTQKKQSIKVVDIRNARHFAQAKDIQPYESGYFRYYYNSDLFVFKPTKKEQTILDLKYAYIAGCKLCPEPGYLPSRAIGGFVDNGLGLVETIMVAPDLLSE